jgi:hypothetical protein
MEDVMAETLEGKIDHRAALGAAVRQAIDEVQDAEFRDVDTGEVGGAPPS